MLGYFFMHFQEKILEIDNPKSFNWEEVYKSILNSSSKLSNSWIKLNLIKTTKSKLYFHLVTINDSDYKPFFNEPYKPYKSYMLYKSKNVSCLIIPTGIGAKFGGYAGDANPIAKALAFNSDILITHPNVVNGSVLTDIPSNVIYLEGFLLDHFLLGQINLTVNNINKIGVIFDSGIGENRIDYEVNVLNASKAFYGAEVTAWTVTDKPLKIITNVNKDGFSSGDIGNLKGLIEKALFLKSKKVDAIAICTLIKDSNKNKKYALGEGLDPIGGIEALISHSVSFYTGLPSAHAPVLTSKERINYKKISPLSAGEYIADTFLPSVINGLRFSPKVTKLDKVIKSGRVINSGNLNSIYVPSSAFGSAGVICSNDHFKNVVLVDENQTALKVDYKHIKTKFKRTKSYLDFISNKDTNISSNSLVRPVERIPRI
jgi:hypothetical protein